MPEIRGLPDGDYSQTKEEGVRRKNNIRYGGRAAGGRRQVTEY